MKANCFLPLEDVGQSTTMTQKYRCSTVCSVPLLLLLSVGAGRWQVVYSPSVELGIPQSYVDDGLCHFPVSSPCLCVYHINMVTVKCVLALRWCKTRADLSFPFTIEMLCSLFLVVLIGHSLTFFIFY